MTIIPALLRRHCALLSAYWTELITSEQKKEDIPKNAQSLCALLTATAINLITSKQDDEFMAKYCKNMTCDGCPFRSTGWKNIKDITEVLERARLEMFLDG